MVRAECSLLCSQEPRCCARVASGLGRLPESIYLWPDFNSKQPAGEVHALSLPPLPPPSPEEVQGHSKLPGRWVMLSTGWAALSPSKSWVLYQKVRMSGNLLTQPHPKSQASCPLLSPHPPKVMFLLWVSCFLLLSWPVACTQLRMVSSSSLFTFVFQFPAANWPHPFESLSPNFQEKAHLFTLGHTSHVAAG